MEENTKEINMSNDEVVGFVKDLISQSQTAIEEEKFDIVSFSRGLQQGMSGYLTPQMVNTNLKNINLNSQVGTYDDILKALQNPKSNEDTIISYSQNQYLTSYLYKRNFDYYANLLSYDLSIISKEDLEYEDYKSPSYKKDWKTVEKFLDKFDYRREFKKVVFNMLNADLYPCMLRTDMSDDKYIFQDFPYKYAKIRGRSAEGLVCDYDLSFLMSGTQDIKMYSPPLQKKYKDLFNSKNRGYLPSAPIGDANNRTFALWVQGDQSENFFAFKLTQDFMTEIPYFSPMLLDTSMGDVYRSLQLNQSIASARKIITSQWPMIKDAKTNTSNNLSVTSTLMGSLIGACMSGLNANEKMFDLIALPSDKIEVHQMENKNGSLYQDYLKTISGLLGGANTLFSVQKQTSTESLMSFDIDKMFMEGVYGQFEEFLNYVVNRETKKYKFKFKLSGTNSYVNKEAKIKEAFDPAKVGICSINKLANAMGMNQIELKREMMATKASGIEQLFMSLSSIYTESGKDASDGGRPKSSTTEISDSGIATRDSGVNIARGGKI